MDMFKKNVLFMFALEQIISVIAAKSIKQKKMYNYIID